MHCTHQQTRQRNTSGFTLIELLVVIAIIALLIGILLPSLSSARKSAWAVVISSNARNVLLADTLYTGNNREYHPPSYVYGADRDSMEWRLNMQRATHPQRINGYIHWSYALFDNGEVPQDAFESPAVTSRGAPRTNPGGNPDDWELGQVNDLGQGEGADWPRDRQVPRLAFAANGAIMPRNKFNPIGAQRKAQLVRQNKIFSPSSTILIAELKDTAQWRSLADPGSESGENVIKSHRPITPFFGLSAGADVYNEPSSLSLPRFSYPEIEQLRQIRKETTYDAIGLIVGQGGSSSSLEAVGDTFNGKATFGYLDGHVELRDLIDTIEDREWGEKFYSISGNNKLVKNADDED